MVKVRIGITGGDFRECYYECTLPSLPRVDDMVWLSKGLTHLEKIAIEKNIKFDDGKYGKRYENGKLKQISFEDCVKVSEVIFEEDTDFVWLILKAL
jgi:hypothetical protein